MKCALYARVSTDKQADKDLSIPAQREAMRDYAKHKGWEVVREFEEPGVSATTANRPELQRLLAAVRSSEFKIDVLLVHKLDRFARSLYDFAVIKAMLQEHGVRLASVVENFEPGVSGELVQGIMAALGQFYSANLSEEVKKGMRQKVLQGGWPHRAPRGYVTTQTATGSVIEIHPTEGPLMKEAFQLYAKGWYSVKTLASRLAQQGLLSSKGTPIAHAHLRRLLVNPFYAGRVQWEGTEVAGLHPALVSAELFESVRTTIQRRHRNPGPKGSVIPGFPLRGLAICAGCRGRMTCERHGHSLYYRCSRQTYQRALCPAKSCNAVRAHKSLEDLCQRFPLRKDLGHGMEIAMAHAMAARVSRLQRARDDRQREETDLLQREQELTQAFTNHELGPDAYATAVQSIRDARQRLTAIDDTPPPSTETLSFEVQRRLHVARSLHDLCRSDSERSRNEILRQVFKTIVLDHEGVTGYTFQPPFDALFGDHADDSRVEHVAHAVVDAAA